MSIEKVRKYKKEIARLSKKRQQLLESFFSKDRLVAGSYMQTRMRCSSPGCHCHKDGGHPTMRISRRQNGKLISHVVRIDDRDWVAEASKNYKALKNALREIAKINSREKEILKLIIEQKAEFYE